MSLLDAIFGGHSGGPSVRGDAGVVHGRTLLRQVGAMGKMLTAQGVRVLAIEMDNGPSWLATDLAAHVNGIATVPIPAFFTEIQRAHALDASGVDALISWRADVPKFHCVAKLQDGVFLQRRDVREPVLPDGTAKVTFTSGTTGTPKGVCLSRAGLEQFVHALAVATSNIGARRHLCLLPLPVLLENLAGAWVSMLQGAEVVLPGLGEMGWTGSSALDIDRLVPLLHSVRPDTVILLPQVLQTLVQHLEHTGQKIDFLKFVAVGGARSAPGLILRARELGVPVYEGYGLSECASVVSLNLPGSDCPGSVGRPLANRQLKVSSDRMVAVRNQGFLGYAGERDEPPAWIDTGDIGRLDEQGFLHIEGRHKNVLITGYGRNVSPEWVESELLAEEGIVQAIVLGDGWARPGALIAGQNNADIESAVLRANERLPDYAQIGAWRPIAPIEPGSRLLTANGRFRRDQVKEAFSGFVGEMERASTKISPRKHA